MTENIFVGDRLVKVFKGDYYGDVVRDPMNGDIIVTEKDKVIALGCTGDAKDSTIEFWEKRLNKKVRFKISTEKFRDTGLEKAVLLPYKRNFEEVKKEKSYSLKEENYYLVKDLKKANRYIEDLKNELKDKNTQLENLSAIMKSIHMQSSGI